MFTVIKSISFFYLNTLNTRFVHFIFLSKYIKYQICTVCFVEVLTETLYPQSRSVVCNEPDIWGQDKCYKIFHMLWQEKGGYNLNNRLERGMTYIYVILQYMFGALRDIVPQMQQVRHMAAPVDLLTHYNAEITGQFTEVSCRCRTLISH